MSASSPTLRRRLRGAAAAAVVTVASLLPQQAFAQALPVPTEIDIEVCWLGTCNDIMFRAQTNINQPVFNPTGGELINSAGPIGFFFFDDISGDIIFVVDAFPGAVFDGTYVNGCLTGTASDYGTYAFLGLFTSNVGCP